MQRVIGCTVDEFILGDFCLNLNIHYTCLPHQNSQISDLLKKKNIGIYQRTFNKMRDLADSFLSFDSPEMFICPALKALVLPHFVCCL